MVRPVSESVQPIGSRLILLDGSTTSSLTRVHVELLPAPNFTTYSSVFDVNSVLPVFQLLPTDGSPADVARPVGARYWRYDGGVTPLAAGNVPVATVCAET